LSHEPSAPGAQRLAREPGSSSIAARRSRCPGTRRASAGRRQARAARMLRSSTRTSHCTPGLRAASRRRRPRRSRHVVLASGSMRSRGDDRVIVRRHDRLVSRLVKGGQMRELACPSDDVGSGRRVPIRCRPPLNGSSHVADHRSAVACPRVRDPIHGRGGRSGHRRRLAVAALTTTPTRSVPELRLRATRAVAAFCRITTGRSAPAAPFRARLADLIDPTLLIQ